jgi:uncharacterized membrane protein YccF (DUF307 family)
MSVLGNILWHIPFLGFVTAIAVYLIGALITITVIGAPIGLGLMEFGKFLFAPFGRAMVSKSDLNIQQNKLWKAYSTVVMVLYFPLGLLMCLAAVFQVVALFITILGIPVALVIAKSLGTYLNPVNKKCVSKAVAEELQRRKAEVEVAKAFGGSVPRRTQPLAEADLSVAVAKEPDPAVPAPAPVAAIAPEDPVAAEALSVSAPTPVVPAAPAEAVPAPVPTPVATERPAARALPWAVLAVVLVAGAALAYYLLRDAPESASTPQRQQASQTSSEASGNVAPAQAATPSSHQVPNRSSMPGSSAESLRPSPGSPWAVICGSIDQNGRNSRSRAETLARRLNDAGINAGVFDGRDFPTFRCCYWSVIAGSFSSKAEAGELVQRVKNRGFDAYRKRAF